MAKRRFHWHDLIDVSCLLTHDLAPSIEGSRKLCRTRLSAGEGAGRHLFDVKIEFIEFIIDANACGRILAADA